MTTRAALWTSIALLAFALPAGASEGATEEYAGRILGAEGQPGIAVTLTILSYTSHDDVLELAQLLLAEGHNAFVVAVSQREAGKLQLGDAHYRINVVRSLDTEEGRLVGAVADGPIQIPGAAEVARSDELAVGYVELLVDAEGAGKGRLLPAAKIIFNEEGFLEARDLGDQQREIVDVGATR